MFDVLVYTNIIWFCTVVISNSVYSNRINIYMERDMKTNIREMLTILVVKKEIYIVTKLLDRLEWL